MQALDTEAGPRATRIGNMAPTRMKKDMTTWTTETSHVMPVRWSSVSTFVWKQHQSYGPGPAEREGAALSGKAHIHGDSKKQTPATSTIAAMVVKMTIPPDQPSTKCAQKSSAVARFHTDE